MVEALTALPVLVLVLASLMYFHALVRAKQLSAASARRAAFGIAFAGCSSGAEGKREGASAPAAIDDVIDAANAKNVSTKSPRYQSVTDIPFLGEALSTLVPQGVRVTKAAKVAKAKLLGFIEDEAASGTVFMTCNQEPTTPEHVARDLFVNTVTELFQ